MRAYDDDTRKSVYVFTCDRSSGETSRSEPMTAKAAGSEVYRIQQSRPEDGVWTESAHDDDVLPIETGLQARKAT